MKSKNLDRKGALILSTVGLYAVAIVLSALTVVMGTKVAEGGWAEFLHILDNMEDVIRNLPNKWLVLIAIMLLFLLKNFVPIPFPFIFMMAGMFFNQFNTILINVCGFCLVLLSKYYWGKKSGGGAALNMLKKYDNVREILLKGGGTAKLGVLVALRLIPSIPVSIVSKIYGGLEFPVWKFMIASIIGFFPKIWTYSVMGGNITQPFTWKFMGPIVFLLILSGTSTLVVNIILERKKGDNQDGKNQPVEE